MKAKFYVFFWVLFIMPTSVFSFNYYPELDSRIIDQSAAEYTFEVTGVGLLDYSSGNGLVLSAIDVGIDHLWVDDMRIKVISPSGTEVILFNFHGGSSNNLDVFFGELPGLMNIDSAPTPIAGWYAPYESFSAFDGEWADGEWTIQISDCCIGYSGTVTRLAAYFGIQSTSERELFAVEFDNSEYIHGIHVGNWLDGVDPVNFSTDQYGVDNHAYYMSSGNAIIHTGTSTNFQTDAISMGAWVKPDSESGVQSFFGMSDGTTSNLYYLGIEDGQYHAEFKNAGVSLHIYGGSPEPGRWEHVGVAFSNGRATLYVNGFEVATETTSFNTLPDCGTSGWVIGAAPFDVSWYNYNGHIDEIWVGSQVLDISGWKQLADRKNGNCVSAINVPITLEGEDPVRYGHNYGAYSQGSNEPTCGVYSGRESWFEITIPSTGAVDIELLEHTGNQISIADAAMAVYSGSCDNMTQIACNDDYNGSVYPTILLSNRTPGEVVYVRVWAFAQGSNGHFAITAVESCRGYATITESEDHLTCNATQGTYQWLDCDNDYAVIAGETNQDFYPEETGNYAVVYTNNACADTSICQNIIICNLDNTVSQDGNSLVANGIGLDYQWLDCDDNQSVINMATEQVFEPSVDGTYSVIVSDGVCTDTSDCEILYICNLDNTVANNGSGLMANATGVFYQWLDCDNNYNVVSTATNQSFIPDSDGNYAVNIYTATCSDTSTCIEVSTLSLEDNDLNEVAIFPNPNSGVFTLDFNGAPVNNVTLLDAQGKVVERLEPVNYQEVSVSVKTGVYFIQAELYDQIRMYRVIIR